MLEDAATLTHCMLEEFLFKGFYKGFLKAFQKPRKAQDGPCIAHKKLPDVLPRASKGTPKALPTSLY